MSNRERRIQEIANAKGREEYKLWSSPSGLKIKISSIAGGGFDKVIERVLATSTDGRPLPHTGKDTLYYPPETINLILTEILKESIPPKNRQNIEIYLKEKERAQ